jgi:hypothetical protein
MSKTRPAEPVKLAASIFYEDRRLFEKTLTELSEKYGSVDFVSVEMPFDYTEYYAKEMGSSLKRRFVFFESLIRPETLPDVKILTNKIEEMYSVNERRQINIDPGYVAMPHMILATGKGY